ncbi:DUF6930 domain-containing protein [Gloeocapsopsis dulcis]|uniref:Uncharacterized protein n=1 Tax=Gloeocapsopsis dulcis AAB1 = 1H9 TaxID=1433147 RepID=A0A6N8FYM6_9CHRO|nr:hypothetical protein [Gloeocapsopsis dulcis]MUL38051.1 hypothetical protein [Gloeocapsopsis dulcis AAB1 = 1H9]WNN91740.1 hypothetical protein P0S91_12010 [Gloeocapsopsis dulcis]
MTMSLNCSTRRRLQKLNQISSVWEGDRRPLSAHKDSEVQGECILWVDGSQGVVRAMDVVAPESGPEAVVRTLLRAMEHPNTPAKPARPQKIVVSDRELQFFLRGVLQELEIVIDYVPQLPLINELYRGFQEVRGEYTPELPPQFAEPLKKKALEIWQAAPWELLEEHQILAIELNQNDVGTLYASVMGMLGMEYGILFYRSQDSLRRFRASVLSEEESPELLEEAFLKQDCLFLTFEQTADEEDEEIDIIDLADLPISQIQPSFGIIHPLEGLRAVLYEEEAAAVFLALDVLARFIRSKRRQLNAEVFPTLSDRYRIALPKNKTRKSVQVDVTVNTMPELAAELEEMAGFSDDEEFVVDDVPSLGTLRDDLIPEDSFLSLGVISWEMVEHLRETVTHFAQPGEMSSGGDGLPVILIQTSRPKAKNLIEAIQTTGGLKGIGFNPGADVFGGDRYDLGVLQTENGELFLFGEFLEDDPVHVAARKKWDERCKKTKGYCGLIIARGLMGASRGQPQLRDMMALFEARSLSPQDLGIGTLQLMPQFE